MKGQTLFLKPKKVIMENIKNVNDLSITDLYNAYLFATEVMDREVVDFYKNVLKKRIEWIRVNNAGR